MTSSRQSAGEGKRLVRRGSTSDLTLSGRARARILWAKLMGLPLGLSIKRPHRCVVKHRNFYHSPMAATRSDGLGVFLRLLRTLGYLRTAQTELSSDVTSCLSKFL